MKKYWSRFWPTKAFIDLGLFGYDKNFFVTEFFFLMVRVIILYMISIAAFVYMDAMSNLKNFVYKFLPMVGPSL